MIKNIEQILVSKYFEYTLLIVLLILGFFVRVYKINNPIADWHSWRQADTASVTKIYIQNGINLFMPRYHDISSIQTGIFNPQGYRMVELPIYNVIHALLFQKIGHFSIEVWGRLLTIITSVVTAFFLYLIGKEIIDKWVGILTAFFYLFIPFNIYFTRVILPDPMGVMFGVISLWTFIKFVNAKKVIFLFVSGLFFALALLIKPYLGFYVVPMVYLAVNKFGLNNIFKQKKLLFQFFIFSLIAIAPFFVWRIWENKFPEGIPFYKWAFNGDNIRFRPSFWYWIFGERLGHLILGSLGVIPFAFGLLNTKVKNLFIHFFLVGALFYVSIVATANVRHDYYQILTIPAISLALSLGVVYLWNNIVFNKYLARGVVVVSIIVMLITGWYQIAGNYNVNHPELIEAGHEIDKITPKDSLIVAPYNGDTAFLYQTNRSGWPAIDDSIGNIIKEGADYYVSVDLGSPDTKIVESMFKTVEKNNKFIIVDLHTQLKTK